jgi:putative two-component system response regulator
VCTQTILIASSEPETFAVLEETLSDLYKIQLARTADEVLQQAQSPAHQDLILLDNSLAGTNGHEICYELKSDPRTSTTPVILLLNQRDHKLEARALEIGAVDYLTYPFNSLIVIARVRTHLALQDQTRTLEQMVRERTAELQASRLQIIRRLSRAVEFRDTETGLHIVRMSQYSHLLARAAGMRPEQADLLLNAAPMHDIGKIGIPEGILLKRGQLTQKEWSTMQAHTTIGARIIENHSRLLETARLVALTHHERWDGSGYPLGLQEGEIPFEGRIVAIADVFDALTSDRPYKEAWTLESALSLIESEQGRHFDPTLARIFLELVPEIEEIREKYQE